MKRTKNQPFWARLKCALNGIRIAAFEETSFRTELIIGLGAVGIFAWVRPPLIWMALCVISASVSLSLELVNTALERLADRLHPESHLSIQVAKDCTAGAVLVASVASAVVGMLALMAGLGWA